MKHKEIGSTLDCRRITKSFAVLSIPQNPYLALTPFSPFPVRADHAPQAQIPRYPAEWVKIKGGGVGERLKPAVLKTVRPERVSGVRIPPPPPAILSCERCRRVIVTRHSFILRPSRGDCPQASPPFAPKLEMHCVCLLPAGSPGWWGLGSSSSSSTPPCRCR